MRRRSAVRLLVVAVAGACAAGVAPAAAAPHAPVSREARARTLYEHAETRLAKNTIDDRRVALRDLEQAVLLEPTNPLYELTLARAYYRAGFLKSARTHFERVTRMAPDDAQGRFGLGQVWRRDWLKYLERSSLDRAVDNFSAAARLDPGACDAWLMLVPLLVEEKELRAAAAAALHALDAESTRAEARLAVAYTAYRLGRVALAQSAFDAAMPGLKPSVRDRFDDIAPVASEQDTAALRRLPPAQRPEFVRRFWKDNDPDLTTPENEAQLEYWARVAHAYFLFYNPRLREWDERGEVYVRYGPPEHVDYNPVGDKLAVTFGTGLDYPANLLVWDYPSLGMTVTLQDRLLSERYMLPISEYEETDPQPDPDSLAAHGDRLATSGGRGVFPVLPPGAYALPVRGEIARFAGDHGGRLLGQLEVPAGPADTLSAEWVVLDSTRTEVARAARPLDPSLCEPGTRRVADFAADLPPGAYQVGLTVHDAHGGRGVYRGTVRVDSAAAGLDLSDVVVSCGVPAVGSGPGVRIAPNPAARVAAGEPLAAYFEIYHLHPDADGQARFRYDYVVQSSVRDKRIWIQRALQPRHPLPDIAASREETNVGPLRRQFVSVPVQTLPAGKYRLEIRVRDLSTGEEVTKSAPFEKLEPGAD